MEVMEKLTSQKSTDPCNECLVDPCKICLEVSRSSRSISTFLFPGLFSFGNFYPPLSFSQVQYKYFSNKYGC